MNSVIPLPYRDQPITSTLNDLSLKHHLIDSNPSRGTPHSHDEGLTSSSAASDPPVMYTPDPSTAGSHPIQQPSPTSPPSAGFSLQPGIDAIQQTGPNTASHLVTRTFRTAGLSQARDILCDGIPYLICLPTDHLWESYSLDCRLLTEVKSHLVETGLLSNKGEWGNAGGERLNRNHLAAWSRGADEAFGLFSRLFNAMLGYLQQSGRSASVKEMVHAGSIEPESTEVGSCRRPDAFLHMVTEATPDKFRWRDLTCPFEYKFGNGDVVDVDNDTKAVWCLHYIMRSDPRRMFSFGSTVHGEKFRIWLLCRTALFTFTPFDWFEDSDSLLKFFIILATSSETDLGFDTNVKRVGSDFDLQFIVQGKIYQTSRLLCDVGADAPTGRGTWVFEVKDQETKAARVIKDYWVEDRPGELEHQIVTGIKKDMGNEKFCKHFINICGHRKIHPSGGSVGVCRVLALRSKPEILVPVPDTPKSIFTAAEGHCLQQIPTKRAPKNLLCSRFRYQVVYDEVGISLFDVTSFADVFGHIGWAVDGLHCLHQAGWIHGDFSPGNIIVVGGKAKLSDLECAKRWVANKLEEMTRPRDTSLPGTGEIRMGTLFFTAVEFEEGHYLFLPQGQGPDEDPEMGDDWEERIFLQNPLHDYESVWWVTVWFVFHSRPKGVPDNVMEEAQEKVYGRSRFSMFFATGPFELACRSLPEVLKPLGNILVKMKRLLVDAYRTIEESFDGSKMLDIFPRLRDCLRVLEERAQGLAVTTPSVLRIFNAEEVKQFDAVALGWEQGGEGSKNTGGPSISLQVADVGVLGKRIQADLPPEMHYMAKRRKFEDGPTVES